MSLLNAGSNNCILVFSPFPAVPFLDFLKNRSQYVLAPVRDAVTTLTCNIQPGAVSESYDIVWFRLNSDGSFSRIVKGISPETFSLTLQLDLINTTTMYRCTVFIDHDGAGTGSPYDGADITLYTTGTFAYSVFTDSDCPAIMRRVKASITEGVQPVGVSINIIILLQFAHTSLIV